MPRYASDPALQSRKALPAFFNAVFSSAANPQEGEIVGALVQRLLTTTAPADLHVFTAHDDKALTGAVIFSRLSFGDDATKALLLSPMAVATEKQGQGLGQGLIRHALGTLRANGTQIVLTYGDPGFYGRLGFQPLDPQQVPPPHPLSQPIGWIGQSLTGKAVPSLPSPCHTVAAFDDPSLW